MYINKDGLFEVGRTLFKKPTVGRLLTTAWFAPLFTAVRQTAVTFRAIDEVLYPEYRDQEIERPVFVFANPRSGTTLTHRLVSMDDDVFTTVKLYQTVFPSVTATRLFQELVKLGDSRLGGLLRRGYDFVNAPLENRWQEVHRLSLDQPEEDVCTQLWSLQSPTTGLLLPFVDEFDSQTWLDAQPDEQRAAFMDCYENTLKRHMYEAGGKRFLNKNVFFAGFVRSMYERFPDAAFVYLIRNPIESLPSFLNMFYQAWMAHSPDIRPDGKEIQALKELGFAYYRYALECRKEIPRDQFIVIRYEDLVEDPKSTILGLYGRLDMPVSEAFEAKLDAASEAHREWESSRDFGLEFFGISEAEVYAELRDVFDAFGYDDPALEPLELEAAE